MRYFNVCIVTKYYFIVRVVPVVVALLVCLVSVRAGKLVPELFVLDQFHNLNYAGRESIR